MRLLILFLLAVTVAAKPRNSKADFELVKKGLTEYFLHKRTPQYFLEALNNYQLPHLFRDDGFELYETSEVCELCNLVVDFLEIERGLGVSRDTLGEEAEYICTHLGIENQRVCHGVIDINLDIILYIIDHGVTSDRVCGSILQSMQCNGPTSFGWSIDIAEGASPNRDLSSSDDSFNILHLSDFHYDPRYTLGANANCEEPICCQNDQPAGNAGDRLCGYWTEYDNADSPWQLITETIRQVTENHRVDYVYYTGDIISHRVWDTSVAANTRDITRLLDYFRESFDVPVFVTFGNHEPHPLNVWPGVNTSDFSINWLFELATEKWSGLIGVNPAEIRETVMGGGYYTVSPTPGFRVIAINSNLCYTTNWWLIYDDVDPFGQLQWLADTLKAAEDNGESVHILTHVPTGSNDCLKTWSREYKRIVERFTNTITGQFNGHTHKDEFHVYYNSTNATQAVGVAYNGASVTPFSNSNPSYKVFNVDRNTFTLLDYEEWTFNLTLANLHPEEESPEWYRLYSFVEAYGVENLQPSEANKVLYNMASDHSLLDKYFRFYFRDGDAGVKNGCDEGCQRDFLCGIAKSEFGDDIQCDYFVSLYDQST